ncbi:MAG TPA: sugar transferase [bacterium]|nr:sugar transferase [bacterium]
MAGGNGQMLTEGRRRQLRALLLIVLDASMIAAAFSLAYLFRFYWEIVPALDEPPVTPYFAVLTPLIPAWILVFAAYGLYRDRIPSHLDEALRITSAVAVGMMALLAASFFYREFSYSRLWILYAWVLSTILLLTARLIMRAAHRLLRMRGIDVRRVLVVGAGQEGRMVVEVLRTRPELGQRPVAFLDPDQQSEVDGLPVAGRPDAVLQTVRRFGAHHVIIALPPDAREVAMRVAAICQEAGVPFAIVPDLYTLVAAGAEVEIVERLPLITPRGSRTGGWGRRVKDASDVAGALFGLLITLPLLVVIALLIVCDSPGPVFFRHVRIGRAGVPFLAWKFRTMRDGADEQLSADSRLRAQYQRSFKLVEDPRVTRIGRWLRRTSLDELPQLINVLKGEMSLVGPRPIVEDELRKYGPWERRLLCVKPGLTGLWQVLRHDEPNYSQRVRLDMYYIDHWSVGLDVKILLNTLPSVITGRGAY